MLKKYFLIGLALFHFTIIIIHNIVSMAGSLQVVYGKEPKAQDKTSALGLSRSFIHFSPIHYYAHISGAATGFGFFAPQVGSQYISLFKVLDAQGKLLAEYHEPMLKQQEGLHRYAAFLDLFQELIAEEKADDHLDKRYARAILYSMAERIGEEVEGAKKVEYQIAVYRYPSLQQYKSASDPTTLNANVISLFENSIELKVYE